VTLNEDDDASADPLTIPYKIVVPFSKIEATIRKIHSSNSSNNPTKEIHVGTTRTTNLINKHFTGISRIIIRNFVSRCTVCQSSKIVSEKQMRRQRFLNPLPDGSLFERLQVDLAFFSDYREDNTTRSVKVPVVQMIDHKSRFRFAKIIPSKHADHIVDFVQSIFTIIGSPLILQCDNGREFVNEKLFNLCAYWGSKIVLSSPYHPQSNGGVENANGSLKAAVRKWQHSNPDADWKAHFHQIIHQLNCSMHHTLGLQPYEYVFGIQSWKQKHLLSNIILDNNNDNINDDISVLDVGSEHESESRCSTPGVPIYAGILSRAFDDIDVFDAAPFESATAIESHSSTYKAYTASTASLPIAILSNPQESISSIPEVNTSIHYPAANASILAGAIDDLKVDTHEEDYGRSFNHREKVDETIRHNIKRMQKAYDKKVQPVSYSLGQVVGIVIPRRERNQYPTAHKVGNICARIFKIETTREVNVVKYLVRNNDFRFTDKFACHSLVALHGGTESYPTEHSWDIQESAIELLKPITLRTYIKDELYNLNEKQKSHTSNPTAIMNTNSSRSVQEIEMVYPKVPCSTCHELVSIMRTRYCSGCKKFMHKLPDDCSKAGQIIAGKDKQIYCNIYCANVCGVYPVMNSKPVIEDYSEETGDKIDLTNDSPEHASGVNATQDAPITNNSTSTAHSKRVRDDIAPTSQQSEVPTVDISLPSPIPAKKVKLKETKNSYYEVPYDEIQRTNKFITYFIAQRKKRYPSWQMTSIRWNTTSLTQLDQVIQEQNFSFKDTTAELGKKVNLYLKSYSSSAMEASASSSTAVETVELSSSSNSSSSNCATCGRNIPPITLITVNEVRYCSTSCYEERL
jgi:hypothetical protein